MSDSPSTDQQSSNSACDSPVEMSLYGECIVYLTMSMSLKGHLDLF